MKTNTNETEQKPPAGTGEPIAPASQLTDLPPTDEQAEQTKGGLPAVQKVRQAAARMGS